MTGAVRRNVRKRLNKNQKQLRQNWEGYHLLEFAKTIRPVKQDTKRRKELDDHLVSNGIGGFETLQKLPADNKTAFTTEKSDGVFESLAEFQDIPTFVCFLNFLEFCRNSIPRRPLDVFDGNDTLSIEIDGKRKAVTLDYAIDDFKRHAKTVEERLKLESSQSSTGQADPIQPRLTIPQARENNPNYFANAVLDVIGRDEQKSRLKAFLECDKNVAWFQLAGVAGQGKSRLAFDLIKVAEELGFRAGFLTENDIKFFKDQWKDWQPDKPYLLIFDYVIGREEQIKPIFQTLISNQDGYCHNIRILLVERQRWDQGNVIETQDQINKDAPRQLIAISNKAPWFLKLCEEGDSEGERLAPFRFDNGVEELKELGQDNLASIVKQLLSGKTLTLSDDVLEETLERIDNTGRPLYAYLLAQQLSESEEGFRSWTKIDLLNGQLKRDKRRWEQAFNDKAPTWGDSHEAMKLAVLATIVRQINFEDEIIKSNFGHIDSSLGKEALAIANSYLVNNDNRPHKIHALEPDLLGEWFVLYCFYQGLNFEELLNIAWEYSPNDTAMFLIRVMQDFIDLTKTYNDWNLTEKLLAHKPPHENHYLVLARVAVFISYELGRRNLTIPHNIIIALEHAANLSNVIAMDYLGFFYQQGLGVVRNPEKAIYWFQMAVNKKSDTAMVNLGICYQKGEGVKQNLNAAFKLFQRAVKLDNSTAMFYLGLCYQRSEGVKEDLNEAFALYQQAADKGNSTATAYLGLCYQYEVGVKQDLDKAISQYQRAVDEGNSLAMVFLGRCYQYGEGVNQNINKAIALYQKATDKGDSTAMTCLALCYQDGKGVDQDWNKAINLYQQAVKKNDCTAMYYLGACYENGYGVKQNRSSAIELYRMAANQGNSNAMVNLGFYYRNGIGVKQNRKEAVKLFQRAAKVGDYRAMCNLGVCYENGEGVDQDWNKAISLYQQATKAGEIRAISNIQNILLRNFLGEGNYKSRKTNGCTRNKLSHLVEKLAFDPPILGGDWKPLLTEEIKACIDKVIVPFEILDVVVEI